MIRAWRKPLEKYYSPNATISILTITFQSLPVDASQRVSVSEVASTLETVVLNENQNHSKYPSTLLILFGLCDKLFIPTVLRQAALLTYKAEINQLRSQLHQVVNNRVFKTK